MVWDIVAVGQFLVVTTAFVGAITGIGVTAYAIVRRTNRLAAGGQPQIGDDRLNRLEQAVDAIAIEVERISEAQRFSAKLLAERNKDSVLHQ